MNDLSVVAPPRESEVDVLEAREAWSEYRLSDGTVLRVKPVVIAITRLQGAEAAHEEPVYNMKSTLITDVRGAKTPPDLG
ncbi:MAG TPA: hypothetical protein VME45_13520 [Stellaceae bacterium]|nr:hypothetical protein [Stellaceae bacterium]